MRRSSYDIQYWLFRDRIPVTKLLIVTNVLTFLAAVVGRIAQIPFYLGFSSAGLASMPWTAFTYPLVGAFGGPLSLLLAGYWLWVAGGSLERSWGSRTFTLFFFIMSAVSALGLYAGGMVTGIPISLVGLWLPLAGTTVAFAMTNPEQVILFFFIIPMKLKYLALIDAALVFISFGMSNPLLGFFALAGCAASYWYVTAGSRMNLQRPGYQRRGEIIDLRPSLTPKRSMNPLKRLHDRREQKRLKDFLDK